MNFADYSEQAKTTIHPDYDAYDHYVPKLFTEIVELYDAFLKQQIYGKDLDRINAKEEIGDAWWYYANILRLQGQILVLPLGFQEARRSRSYPDDLEQLGNVLVDSACEVKLSWTDYKSNHHWGFKRTLDQRIDQMMGILDVVRRKLGFTQDEVWKANLRKLFDPEKGRYREGVFTKEGATNRDTRAEREALEKDTE